MSEEIEAPTRGSTIFATILLIAMIGFAVVGEHNNDKAWDNMVKHLKLWTGLD